MSEPMLAVRHTTGADGPYWRALAAGRVELPRCAGCGRWHWPAVFRCGECGSWDQQWHAVEPEGTVFSWTRTWHAFDGSEKIGLPFVSLVVELPQCGGRRLLGLLEGEAGGLRIGAAVRARVAETEIWGERIPALRWTLSGASS
ncbi:Zn-ribbon domain-containing OB-fold protein [Solimonas soli]|uniref:Zn-ribbon domain-containing OB-fold protein n=1 Tax=Solimonas soli TaxID=413479 RepID=UPI00047FA4FE|nr:OB-fold domain-containing protein [Solimonas soli]